MNGRKEIAGQNETNFRLCKENNGRFTEGFISYGYGFICHGFTDEEIRSALDWVICLWIFSFLSFRIKFY